jgi:hypothetical protein
MSLKAYLHILHGFAEPCGELTKISLNRVDSGVDALLIYPTFNGFLEGMPISFQIIFGWPVSQALVH